MKARYDAFLAKHPKLDRGNHANHLGTLGTGNHFIELCLDESDTVWFMLHSGSRGVGNRMGNYVIDLARKDMKKFFINLPDIDLAYFPERTEHFDDYVEAVEWAQDYARLNRDLMREQIVAAVRNSGDVPPFSAELKAINLSPQLGGPRITFWRERSHHAEGRSSRARERHGNHSGQYRSAVLHCAWQRKPGELLQ